MSSANVYTTQTLVDNILLVSHAPGGNITFKASDIVTLADRELQTPIIKQILSTRGGYYRTYADYAINALGEYVIPGDAIAGALDNVELVDGTTVIQVDEISESDQFCTEVPTSTGYGYFMRGNTVKILPLPNLGVARLWYFKRPSHLVLPSQAAQVSAVNGAVVSVSSLPSTFTALSDVDTVGDQPPFNILGEYSIIAINGTDLTLDQAVTTDVVVGDWIALHNQTCVPQIPVEYRVLLEQRVVVKIYELQGYKEKQAVAQNSLKELEEAALSLITPRVKSQTKVISTARGGFLAGNINRLMNFVAR